MSLSKQGSENIPNFSRGHRQGSAMFVDPESSGNTKLPAGARRVSAVSPEWETFGGTQSSSLSPGDIDVENLLKVMSTMDAGTSNKVARKFNIDPIRGTFDTQKVEAAYRKQSVVNKETHATVYVYAVMALVLAAVPQISSWERLSWLFIGGVFLAALLEGLSSSVSRCGYLSRMFMYMISVVILLSGVTLSPIFSHLEYCNDDSCMILPTSNLYTAEKEHRNLSMAVKMDEMGAINGTSSIVLSNETVDALGRMLQASMASQASIGLISMLPVTKRGIISAYGSLVMWVILFTILVAATWPSAFEFPYEYGICSALCCLTALATVYGEWNRQIFARIMWWRHRVMRTHKRHVVHLALGQRSRFNDKKPLSDMQKSSIETFRKNPTIAPLLIEESKLAIVEEIGRGAMGEVYKGYYCDTMVAVKRIPRHMVDPQTLASFTNEIVIMQSLRHPNIIQLLGVTCNDSNFVAGIFEHMPRDNLRSVLQDSSLTLTWEDPKCKLAIDVARGMAYLHDKQVIHRDLKTDNILVSSTFTCKVADFGTSAFLKSMQCSQIGTPFWRAPEMIRGEQYTTKADVYSFSMLLLEVQTRTNPFEQVSQQESLDLTMRVAQDNWRFSIPADTPKEISSLIEDCWNPDPQCRPTFVIVLRRLQKYLKSLTVGEEEEGEANLAKLMLDHMIMSGRYVKESYKDGECIIKAGEVGEHCYIVLKGEVSIMRQHKNFMTQTPRHTTISKMQLIRVVPTGSYFGEMALLAHAKRVASCFAKGNVTCIKFDRQAFLEVYDDEIHGRVAAQVVKLLQSSETSKESSAPEKKILQTMGSLRSEGVYSVRNLHLKVATAIEEKDEEPNEGSEKSRRATVGCSPSMKEKSEANSSTASEPEVPNEGVSDPEGLKTEDRTGDSGTRDENNSVGTEEDNCAGLGDPDQGKNLESSAPDTSEKKGSVPLRVDTGMLPEIK